MRIASYVFYGLAVLSALAGISSASILKDEIGHWFGTGTVIVFGGATLLCLLIALVAQNLAKQRED